MRFWPLCAALTLCIVSIDSDAMAKPELKHSYPEKPPLPGKPDKQLPDETTQLLNPYPEEPIGALIETQGNTSAQAEGHNYVALSSAYVQQVQSSISRRRARSPSPTSHCCHCPDALRCCWRGGCLACTIAALPVCGLSAVMKGPCVPLCGAWGGIVALSAGAWCCDVGRYNYRVEQLEDLYHGKKWEKFDQLAAALEPQSREGSTSIFHYATKYRNLCIFRKKGLERMQAEAFEEQLQAEREKVQPAEITTASSSGASDDSR